MPAKELHATFEDAWNCDECNKILNAYQDLLQARFESIRKAENRIDERKEDIEKKVWNRKKKLPRDYLDRMADIALTHELDKIGLIFEDFKVTELFKRYLFSLNNECRDDFKAGVLTSRIRNEFKKHNLILASDAQLSKGNRKWVIVVNDTERYLVEDTGTDLIISFQRDETSRGAFYNHLNELVRYDILKKNGTIYSRGPNSNQNYVRTFLIKRQIERYPPKDICWISGSGTGIFTIGLFGTPNRSISADITQKLSDELGIALKKYLPADKMPDLIVLHTGGMRKASDRDIYI
jgi:hypothetical protein